MSPLMEAYLPMKENISLVISQPLGSFGLLLKTGRPPAERMGNSVKWCILKKHPHQMEEWTTPKKVTEDAQNSPKREKGT